MGQYENNLYEEALKKIVSLKLAVQQWNDRHEKRAPVDLLVCFALRDVGYKPYEVMRMSGGVDAEIISYPYPSRYGASVMVRVPKDTGELFECAVKPSAIADAEERSKGGNTTRKRNNK